MQLDYQIEEMLLQSPNLVVYKARGRNGYRYAISRFIFPKSILANLNEACFEASLSELKRLNHGCLRPVIDGGLDEIDGLPWIARVWWDGESLEDRMEANTLMPNDIQRLADHGQSLIDALGDRASAISFRARDVVLTNSRSGQGVETFDIDVQNWFRDWAMGTPPGGGKNARAELSRLVTEAESTELGPAMISEEEYLIGQAQMVAPPPPPTQPMVPSPPPTQPLIPAPHPTQPVYVAAPPTQPVYVAAPPTQPLVPSPHPTQPMVAGPPSLQPVLDSPYPNQAPVESPYPAQPLMPSPHPTQPLEAAPSQTEPAVESPPPANASPRLNIQDRTPNVPRFNFS